MQDKINVAILDMYDGEPNQGMRCIQDILGRFQSEITCKTYNVRQHAEIPDVSEYDLYISSGGPGSPLEGDGNWDVKYYALLDSIYEWNKQHEQKKYILFICHSYQMAIKHFGLAEITKRKSTSFGVMTIHKTDAGMDDPLFENLDNPFWAVDSRDYQVVQPHHKKFREMGAQIIALEKIRTHVEYERAIMAVRFSPEMVGTQFHPEADPESFHVHLRKPEVREKIINMRGRVRYLRMLEHLVEEHTIYKTNETLIPNFIRQSIDLINQQHAYTH